MGAGRRSDGRRGRRVPAGARPPLGELPRSYPGHRRFCGGYVTGVAGGRMRRLALFVSVVAVWVALPADADAARVAHRPPPRRGCRDCCEGGRAPSRISPSKSRSDPCTRRRASRRPFAPRYPGDPVRRAAPDAAAAGTPTDPLVSKQRCLTQSRFSESSLTLPAFERIPVAVIDSGLDTGHPELPGKVLGAKSFVGGSARQIRSAHTTFVAGLIAYGVDDGIGSRSRAFRRASGRQGRNALAGDSRGGGGQAIRWAVKLGAP